MIHATFEVIERSWSEGEYFCLVKMWLSQIRGPYTLSSFVHCTIRYFFGAAGKPVILFFQFLVLLLIYFRPSTVHPVLN